MGSGADELRLRDSQQQPGDNMTDSALDAQQTAWRLAKRYASLTARQEGHATPRTCLGSSELEPNKAKAAEEAEFTSCK